MWKQVITPTLVVAGFWVCASLSTTAFIYWLDQSHQRVYTESLQSLQAAGEIREQVWRLASLAESPEEPHASAPLPLPPTAVDRVGQSLVVLRGVATTADQKRLVHQLDDQWSKLVDRMQSPRWRVDRHVTDVVQELRGAAAAISATLQQIRLANEQLWRSTEESRDFWTGIVFTTRFLLLVVGPAIGLALGWWMSQRLHRSISQINIILRGAAVELDQNLGNLRLTGREDLVELRDQVERVVKRMSQVSAELNSARLETLRSERLAAVGELAAGVAHELRNPLTSVKLLLQNAAMQPGETRVTDEAMCVMLDEILRMENTIQELLDFSRPPTPKRQRHDLCDTLQRGLNLVQGRAKQHRVRIETHIAHRPLFVNGDPEQLHQVCVNLLINAFEADAGGILEIHADTDPAEHLVRVRFRDFGPGIPDDILVHLFEPFVSAKPGGTGLGLAVSRRIVIQHGGSLSAENHPQGGALFTLTLPSADRPEPRELTSGRGVPRVVAEPPAP